MNTNGIISGVSVAHNVASLDQLEAVPVETNREAVSSLLSSDAVSEAFVLQTCNRVEAYVVTEDSARGRAVLVDHFEAVAPSVRRELDHEASLQHLLRVAAGLESLVLGEDQIIGQVRSAYEDARAADGIGPVLETGVTKAIRTGERARTETAINDGVVSLASAAVKLVAEKHGLDGARAAVVGTGEMGTLAAKRLADRVEELLVVNRTLAHADRVAETVKPTSTIVQPMGLDALSEAIDRADLAITATGSPKPILEVEDLAAVGETFLVDITRPRDVTPAADELSHLTVFDLDTLEGVTEKTRMRRREAAEDVEAIVEEEFERLLVQYKRQRADQVISSMYESAELVKTAELERTLDQLDLDEADEAAVESMADAIVSQLLAPPTDSLRDAAENDDWSTIHTALQLFDPRFGPEADDISPEVFSDLVGQESDQPIEADSGDD